MIIIIIIIIIIMVVRACNVTPSEVKVGWLVFGWCCFVCLLVLFVVESLVLVGQSFGRKFQQLPAVFVSVRRPASMIVVPYYKKATGRWVLLSGPRPFVLRSTFFLLLFRGSSRNCVTVGRYCIPYATSKYVALVCVCVCLCVPQCACNGDSSYCC